MELSTHPQLPSDMWRIIISKITSSSHPEEQEYCWHVELAFISSVSTQINALCNAHKRQLGIQNLKASIWEFQSYFAWENYLNCLKYVHQNCGHLCTGIGSTAMDRGSIDCIKYIVDHGGYFASNDLISGSERGDLESIEYILDKEEGGAGQWHDDILAIAAEKGHLHIIKYFNEKENRWTPSIIYSAIYGGQLEILKYAHEAGREFPSDVCKIAVQTRMDRIKRLACVKYVHDTRPESHQKDCPFKFDQICAWITERGCTIVEKDAYFMYPDPDEESDAM